jgi:hypothetical protein
VQSVPALEIAIGKVVVVLVVHRDDRAIRAGEGEGLDNGHVRDPRPGHNLSGKGVLGSRLVDVHHLNGERHNAGSVVRRGRQQEVARRGVCSVEAMGRREDLSSLANEDSAANGARAALKVPVLQEDLHVAGLHWVLPRVFAHLVGLVQTHRVGKGHPCKGCHHDAGHKDANDEAPAPGHVGIRGTHSNRIGLAVGIVDGRRGGGCRRPSGGNGLVSGSGRRGNTARAEFAHVFWAQRRRQRAGRAAKLCYLK